MLQIDPGSATPPYEQLRAQLIAQIKAGELPQGTRLPSVRRLAGDLGLSPNTVARAYRELENAGLLQGMGRNGTVVSSPPPIEPDTDESALSLTRRYLAAMHTLGIEAGVVHRYIQRAIE